MARPALAIGTDGKVTATRTTRDFVAKTLLRDLDGVTRPIGRHSQFVVKPNSGHVRSH